MNQISASTWSPMVSGPEEDFSNFLEFGDLQLAFPGFDGAPQNCAEAREDGGAMDTSTENPAGMMGLENEQMQQPLEQPTTMATINGFHASAQPFPDMGMQAEFLEQQPQPHYVMQGQQYHGQHIVPPTPRSIEMHGDPTRYSQQPVDSQAQAMYEHYRRKQKDQMVFTPLVSPAVTPLDTHFRYPEYPVPGEYFSPLTSPALEAQNHAAQRSVYGAVRGPDTSNTTSPIDMNLDFGASASTSNPAAVRKSRRKTSSAALKNPARAVRQSPSMKPQSSRRKQSTSTTIPPKEVAGIIEDARRAKASNNRPMTADGKPPLPHSQDSSEAESISPEPLSEILMPPPATPKSTSASRSPYLAARQAGSQETSAPVPILDNAPATPASLMKIRKQAGKGTNGPHRPSSLKEQANMAEADMEQIMEDMALPEPAKPNTKPSLTPINTEGANDNDATPTLSARKTPKFGPQSAPLSATSSVFPSPLASPHGVTPGRRGDLKVTGKKRNSSHSVHVSPALRPKMSPSIKPLLPEGAIVNAETSALLLASKSNYQNILEGNHLPGVSYPEALSTNLTSKRTSHKIAEQGRRNRINTALQEIASLLPPPPINGSNHQSPKDGQEGGAVGSMMMTGTAAQQSNSKASTVEMAIEYIKSLQGELKDVKGKLMEAEKKLEKK